jgi:heterodisulfide reductase subunit A2
MSSDTLIIGGGPAGLSAAAALAQGGRSVVIVDRGDAPGGQTSNWCCLATDRCQRCGLCLLHDVQTRVGRTDSIRRITADVTAIAGTRGKFRATLKATAKGGEVDATLEADTVVLATGFEPFDPRRGRPMGYGDLDAVVTTVDVNRALRDDDLSLLHFGGDATKRIAFLQCIGSRDPEAGRGYCSQVCCQGSLRAARALLHRHPDWEITVFFMDLQIYGKTARSRFAELAPKLRFVQGVPAEVQPDGDGGLRLAFQDNLGMMTAESFDGVVLAVGMVPSSGADVLGESLGLTRTLGDFLDGDSAPDGVYVAGTCAGPSFIEASLLSGRQAAGRLLKQTATPCTRRTAVIGRGDEGNVAAEALAAAGVPVTLVQLDRTAPPPQGTGVELVLADAVVDVQGQLGHYRVGVTDGAESSQVAAEALVLAPGLTLTADPSPELASLPHLSTSDFAASLEADTAPRRVAVQLDPAGPAWRPTAAAALDTAIGAVTEGKAEVTVLFEHMALAGLHGQQQYDNARRAGVKFLRQSTPATRADGDETALILTDAAAPEITVRLPVDALAVTEHPGVDETLSTLVQCCGVGLDPEGLAQRGNVRLFPMHSDRPGIWVLGNARQEAGAQTVRAEATSVAAEVHALLSDDLRFTRAAPAQIDKGHCVHCLTCVRVCPHSAITARTESTPLVSATACEQCGACVAACPGEAITLTPEAISSPALPTPGVGDGQTVFFACKNSGAPALALALESATLPSDATVVELACGGAMSELDMLRAFQAGAGRVVLLSCHAESCAHGDNHQHCAQRALLLAATTKRVGLPAGAFEHWTVAPAEGRRVAHELAASTLKGGAQ